MITAKSMRRILPVVAAAGLAVSLVACSSGGTSDPTSAAPDTSAATTGGTIDVGIGEIAVDGMSKIAVMVQAGPTYSDSAAKADAAKAAAEEFGTSVDIYWSDLDPNTELSNYNTIINSGKYDGLAIQSVSPQMCKVIADTVVDAGLLVAPFGGPLCDDGTGVGDELKAPGTITYIDQYNLIDGALAMFNGAADVLGDGPQKVLQVWGTEGHTTTVAHEVAWEEFAAEHPDWELAGAVYSDWTTPGAYESTQNLLQTNPDTTVIFTCYVDITAGVVKAVQEAGLEDQISIFETSGGSDVSIQFVKDGSITGSIPVYSYFGGWAAVKALVDAANGEEVPGFIGPDRAEEVGMITADTVDDFVSTFTTP